MRVIRLAGVGGTEVLRIGEAEMPQPDTGEVLIRVAAAGVNRADLYQRQGLYPPPPGASEILGLEIAGEIVAMGPARRSAGTLAIRCAHWYRAADTPSTAWRMEEAVCRFRRIWNLRRPLLCLRLHLPCGQTSSIRRRIHPGDRFLMQGGTSGIGTFAIQAAKAFGAAVAATAGSQKNADSCWNWAANAAFCYREEDWETGVLDWSGGKGVDVVLDMVGGDYFAKHIKVLAKDGRLVHIATTAGNKVELDLRALMAKRLIVTGSTLRSRSVEEKTDLARWS